MYKKGAQVFDKSREQQPRKLLNYWNKELTRKKKKGDKKRVGENYNLQYMPLMCKTPATSPQKSTSSKTNARVPHLFELQIFCRADSVKLTYTKAMIMQYSHRDYVPLDSFNINNI